MDLRDQLQQALGMSYVVQRELGGGGMSRVFVAHEVALDRRVVVKVLPPELIAGVNVERFKREILLAARLQHPHIVPIHSAGEIAHPTKGWAIPYYTMPFVEGENLRGRLSGGPMPIAEILPILRDVARALAYAHERGIVHRDIKPDNVLLSAGSGMVTDFGIAKALSDARTGDPDQPLTGVGMTIGTPAYLAPEQATGDPATDHRADLYSFGCLAYELLTGHPPFIDQSRHRLVSAHLSDAPRPVTDLRPDTPPALAELVMHCLAKDADHRPQRAAEVVSRLDMVTSGSGGEAMPAILLGPRGMLGRALAMYAAAFIAVAIVARAAIVAIGLPDWVFPGALIVMALGLPIILLTGYAYHVTLRHVTTTPPRTPGGTPASRPRALDAFALKAGRHLSWRRASMGGVYAFAVFVAAITVFMALRALGIGPAGSLLAAGRLAHREPLLLTDFKVANADPALGPVVSDAVRAGLAQSPVLALVSPSALAAGLRRMERPATTRLTLPVALELAHREGIKAVVDGEVTGLAGGYIVTVRLLSADSAIELASVRETGDGPRGLIDAADKAARHLRGRVGESLRSVQASPPLVRATTASLEALKKYSAGVRANAIEGDPVKAVAALRQAVAIDSTFASAWRLLATAMRNAGMPSASSDSAIVRAYAFRQRLPEGERLNVEGTYFFWGPHRDRDKAIAVLRMAIEQGDSAIAASNLGYVHYTRREFARAESLFAMGIRTSGQALFSTNAIEMQLAQNKFAEASRTLAAARQRFGDTRGIRWRAFMLHYNRGDLDSAQALVDDMRASGDPSVAGLARDLAAALHLVRGRRTAARRALLESQRSRGSVAVTRIPLRDSLEMLYVDAWYEPSAAQVQRLDRLLADFPIRDIAPPDRPYFLASSIYAIAGRPDKARQLMQRYRAEVTDTALRRLQTAASHVPLGEIALAERRPLDAIAEFRAADRDYDGHPASDCAPCVAFNLARAFDAAEQPDSAIASYERFFAEGFSVRYLPATDGIGRAFAHRRLGELYEARGDAARAASHYKAFVALWKDADAELQPQVADVRRRIQRLERRAR